MNILKQVNFTLLIILFIVSSSLAQEDVLRPNKDFVGEGPGKAKKQHSKKNHPFTIGVEGGLNVNFFSQQMTWYPQTTYRHGSIFDGLTSATGLSPHFGIIGDYAFNDKMGIQLKLSYDMKYVSSSTTGYDYALTGYDQFNNQVYSNKPMNLTVSSKANYLTFTPLFRAYLIKNLFITIGPSIHLLLGNIETTWEPNSIDGTPLTNYGWWNSPSFNPPFVGNSGARTISEPKSLSARIGLEAGIGYKIPITEHFSIVPQARFQYMLIPITDDQVVNVYNTPIVYETSSNRMLHSLQFALGFWWDL